MKRYMIRLNKNGRLVARGTAFECTQQLNFSSVNSFRSMISHSKSGVNKKYIVKLLDKE